MNSVVSKDDFHFTITLSSGLIVLASRDDTAALLQTIDEINRLMSSLLTATCHADDLYGHQHQLTEQLRSQWLAHHKMMDKLLLARDILNA